jgi:hypothetical protein
VAQIPKIIDVDLLRNSARLLRFFIRSRLVALDIREMVHSRRFLGYLCFGWVGFGRDIELRLVWNMQQSGRLLWVAVESDSPFFKHDDMVANRNEETQRVRDQDAGPILHKRTSQALDKVSSRVRIDSSNDVVQEDNPGVAIECPSQSDSGLLTARKNSA